MTSTSTITIDKITLSLNQIIDYKVNNEIFKGKIIFISPSIGEKGWMKLENVVDQNIDWISIYNWKHYYDQGFFGKVAEAFMSTKPPTDIHI